MRNLLIITALLIGLNTFVRGQEKTGVGILALTYVKGAVTDQDVRSIQETVINAFMKTKRFNVIDRSKIDALKKEGDVQKPADLIDETVLQQWASVGAQFLITGQIIDAQAIQMKADDGEGNITTTYKAKLSINLKIIDVASGQTITSETLEPKAGNSMLGAIGIGAATAEQAISKAIKAIEDKVDDFVGRNFPQAFSIAEIQEKDGKGSAVKLLIAGGSAFGLKKGDKLKVVELCEIDVNGKKIVRKKEIGELKIVKVEDENFSICSVTSGGLDINNKFAAKAKLQIVTKD